MDDLLYTGTLGEVFGVVAELNTCPHNLGLQSSVQNIKHLAYLSTHTTGVPDWVVGSLVLVAQGIVSQSVEH